MQIGKYLEISECLHINAISNGIYWVKYSYDGEPQLTYDYTIQKYITDNSLDYTQNEDFDNILNSEFDFDMYEDDSIDGMISLMTESEKNYIFSKKPPHFVSPVSVDTNYVKTYFNKNISYVESKQNLIFLLTNDTNCYSLYIRDKYNRPIVSYFDYRRYSYTTDKNCLYFNSNINNWENNDQQYNWCCENLDEIMKYAIDNEYTICILTGESNTFDSYFFGNSDKTFNIMSNCYQPQPDLLFHLNWCGTKPPNNINDYSDLDVPEKNNRYFTCTFGNSTVNNEPFVSFKNNIQESQDETLPNYNPFLNFNNNYGFDNSSDSSDAITEPYDSTEYIEKKVAEKLVISESDSDDSSSDESEAINNFVIETKVIATSILVDYSDSDDSSSDEPEPANKKRKCCSNTNMDKQIQLEKTNIEIKNLINNTIDENKEITSATNKKRKFCFTMCCRKK